MAKQLEPWGGEVRMPVWLRRILRRGLPPDDSDECAHERRKPEYSELSVHEQADRAIFGAFSEGHPGNKRERHRH